MKTRLALFTLLTLCFFALPLCTSVMAGEKKCKPSMTRSELQKILLQGSINRGKNYINLSGMNFCNMKLSGINFKGTDLSNSSFEGSDLLNAKFTDSNITGANFRNTNLDGAEFSGGLDLSNVDLSGARITNRTDFRFVYGLNTAKFDRTYECKGTKPLCATD